MVLASTHLLRKTQWAVRLGPVTRCHPLRTSRLTAHGISVLIPEMHNFPATRFLLHGFLPFHDSKKYLAKRLCKWVLGSSEILVLEVFVSRRESCCSVHELLHSLIKQSPRYRHEVFVSQWFAGHGGVLNVCLTLAKEWCWRSGLDKQVLTTMCLMKTAPHPHFAIGRVGHSAHTSVLTRKSLFSV